MSPITIVSSGGLWYFPSASCTCRCGDGRNAAPNLEERKIVMITSDKEVLERYNGATIVNGPDRTSLMFAVFEGSEVFFRLENQHDETLVRIWGIRNHDSDRRNWTISGEIMTDPAKPISFEARYWMRDGKRFGNFKIS